MGYSMFVHVISMVAPQKGAGKKKQNDSSMMFSPEFPRFSKCSAPSGYDIHSLPWKDPPFYS
jgi:hypothetical protein